MISKELLSLVSGMEVLSVNKQSHVNRLHYTTLHKTVDTLKSHYINLDTLGRLCKEWCWGDCKEAINSMPTKDGWFATSTTYYEMSLDGFEANTELEAIIKATDWVAKEKGLI